LDLSEAITALRNAIEAMQASQRPQENARSFIQSIRKAVLLADALGLKSSSRAAAWIQKSQVPQDQTVDYTYHSGGIIQTLKDLENELIGEKQDLDKTEVSAKQSFDMDAQANSDTREEQERQLAKNRENVSRLTGEIGTAQSDLTETTAKLRDDQAYLTDLTKNCNDKAATWDQRVQMRQDELAAIAQASQIIKDTVDKKTKGTIRFTQAANDEISSFVQLSHISHHHFSGMTKRQQVSVGFLQPANTRERVVALLRQKSAQFKSAAFATLASKAAADPFKKIKILIQELIDRLTKEAQNDQDHNNWCKTQTEQATQQRDIRAGEVKESNNALARGEARRDKLDEKVRVLTAEIQKLEEEYDQAKTERDAEKEQNAATVTEAEEGQAALEEAEEVLKKFYEASASASVKKSLAQQGEGDFGVDDDAPDAGFKNHEAYKGSQSASKGILGMLEVIKSDFKRTVAETQKAEREANLDFIKVFEGENKASRAEKNTLKDTAQTNLDETKTQISSDTNSLEESQDLLEKAVQELMDLNEACVKTEMSYEERVKRREDEISSLKQALCILDKEGPVQSGEC